ncbi:MAG: hypothetical protein JWR17_4760 [Pseudomonas sp.]|jgi:hypothetical protein|uniref:DUF421 domain-containing protein n=1 Tax=Pseudomonas sp. TaxID=306 RepID=UPI0026032916|nr:YetF domain-containing protein [Pseudomonas sp.]MDB6052014.1 hypothetical protein [Pseudomonas sp.]
MSENLGTVQRLLMGDAPWVFLLEIILRTVTIYIVLFIVMRLMGKRMAAQLSISEMAVMITLGAAIGVPLQTPAQGLLPAAVLLVSALLFQRGLSYAAYRRRRVEIATQGDVTLLLEDGRLLLENLGKAGLSIARVHSTLRAMDIQHLGELRRIYLEATGDFTLVKYRTPHVGLWIMPGSDEDFVHRTGAVEAQACARCGYVTGRTKSEPCPHCQCTDWSTSAHRLGVSIQGAIKD